MDEEIIDLDAIAPKSAKLKVGGQFIEVPAPKTGDVLALGSLGQKLQELDKLSNVETEELVDALTALLFKIIPGLEVALEGKQLGTAQFLRVINMVTQMAIPPDVKELDKLGITPLDPKPAA